jgi:hypothetical protein
VSISLSANPPASAWTEPQWRNDALEWIESHVGPTGELRWLKPRPWSAVACATTLDGVVWFKEVSPRLAEEPALTAMLARHAPHMLPEVIAAEGTRLLTRDAGPHLGTFVRTGGTMATAALERTVASYAELEIGLVPIARDFPALDARPATLIHSFGEAAVPLVAALGDAIPLSLVHLDPFKKNVCLRGREVVFLDWAVPARGHPFCGMQVIVRMLVQHLRARPDGRETRAIRDAFLEPWTSYAPAHELRGIFAAAIPLGALCRVLRWQQLLEAVPADLRGAYAGGADKWHKSFRESVLMLDRLAT